MLVKTKINGKNAYVSYMDDKMNPVSKKDAIIIKVVVEDGPTLWLNKEGGSHTTDKKIKNFASKKG